MLKSEKNVKYVFSNTGIYPLTMVLRTREQRREGYFFILFLSFLVLNF